MFKLLNLCYSHHKQRVSTNLGNTLLRKIGGGCKGASNNNLNDTESRVLQKLFSELSDQRTQEPFLDCKILMCVSGGMDSIAMMHILKILQLKYLPKLILEVVTFNHRQRHESFEESEFVQSTALAHGIPCHVFTADENAFLGVGLQAAAREWRRQSCLDIVKLSASQLKNTKHFIATAHTDDDQVETLMLKMLRGTHLSHLQPMKYLDGLFLRPLMMLPKSELAQYLTTRGLPWREDLSNQSPDKYKRNRVRLQLVPLLRQLAGSNSALKARLNHMSEQSAELESWILREVQALQPEFQFVSSPESLHAPHVLKYSTALLKAPPLVQSHIVSTWASQSTGLSLSYQAVKALAALLHDTKAHISSATIILGWKAESCSGELRLVPAKCEEQRSQCVTSTVRLPDSVELQVQHPSNFSVSSTVDTPAGYFTAERYSVAVRWPAPGSVALPTAATTVVLREVAVGDKFLPPWRSHAVKMGQFLRSQGVARWDRSRVMVLATHSSESSVILAVLLSPSKVLVSRWADPSTALAGDMVFALDIVKEC